MRFEHFPFHVRIHSNWQTYLLAFRRKTRRGKRAKDLRIPCSSTPPIWIRKTRRVKAGEIANRNVLRERNERSGGPPFLKLDWKYTGNTLESCTRNQTPPLQARESNTVSRLSTNVLFYLAHDRFILLKVEKGGYASLTFAQDLNFAW